MTGFNLNLVRLTESYALCLSTEGKSTKTIIWYTANLKRFAQFLGDNHLSDSVDEIGKEEARRFISHLQIQHRFLFLDYCLFRSSSLYYRLVA